MRVKRKKDQKVYSYSGDLKEEIEKAKAEYEKKKDAQERLFSFYGNSKRRRKRMKHTNSGSRI